MKNSLLKKLLSIAVCSAMSLTFVACSGGDTTQTSGTTTSSTNTNTNTSSDVIQLEFWYAYTDKIQENNIALSEEFNATVGAEKGIEIVPVYQGDYNETHQKLQSAYIANQAPAISVMEIASTKLFAENGVITPLDDLIARDSVDIDDFYAGLTENCIVDGTYYGLPYLRSTPIFYMNTALLEQAGLDTKGPESWAEFAEYCKVIKEETGAYGFAMYSYDWLLEAFFLQYGSSVLNAEETASNINTPEAKEIFSFFKDLIDQDLIIAYSNADATMLTTEMMNQTSAMWCGSTGSMTNFMSIANDNGFEIATAFIPKQEDYGVPTGGCNLVITSKISDAEKEAAWEFVKWITSTENTVKSSISTGYVTTRQSATETEEIQNLFETTPQAKVALDQLQAFGYGRPMHSNYAEVIKEMNNAMDAIWVNGLDIDENLANAETRINSIIS